MQKPKNLLPGLFLCVFSRTAEPLVDFIAVIYWLFPLFYLGQTFFAGKKGVSGPFYIGPFYTGPFCAPIPQKTPPHPTKGPHAKNPREPVAPLNAHLEIPPQKDPAHAAPLQARGSIWHAAVPKRPPFRHTLNRLKTILLGPCTANLALFTHTKGPHAKNPGNKSRGFG